jgi:hypothetical protein
LPFPARFPQNPSTWAEISPAVLKKNPNSKKLCNIGQSRPGSGSSWTGFSVKFNWKPGPWTSFPSILKGNLALGQNNPSIFREKKSSAYSKAINLVT